MSTNNENTMRELNASVRECQRLAVLKAYVGDQDYKGSIYKPKC